MLSSFYTSLNQCLWSRMPLWHTTLCEQAHREWRSTDYSHTVFLKEIKEIYKFVVVQTVVAEVKHTLYRSLRGMFNYPLQVLQLKVSNTHMTNHAFLLECNKRWQCLIYNLIKIGKLYIVNVYYINKIDVQSFHALINTAGNTHCRVVPSVLTILTITSYLGRQIVLITRNLLQSLTKHCFCLIMTIIWRNINKIDACVNSRKNRVDPPALIK